MKVLANNFTVANVLRRICLTIYYPNNSYAYRNRGDKSEHCHTTVARYLRDIGKSSDVIVLLGSRQSNTVMHSIVINKQGDVVADSYAPGLKEGEGLHAEAGSYTFSEGSTKHEYFVMGLKRFGDLYCENS